MNREAAVNVSLLRSRSQASLVYGNVVALTIVTDFLGLTHFSRTLRKPQECCAQEPVHSQVVTRLYQEYAILSGEERADPFPLLSWVLKQGSF